MIIPRCNQALFEPGNPWGFEMDSPRSFTTTGSATT